MQCFILKGRDKATGETVYWTGRAGMLYADRDPAQAFVAGRELIERRMQQFNNNLAPVKWVEVVAL